MPLSLEKPSNLVDKATCTVQNYCARIYIGVQMVFRFLIPSRLVKNYNGIKCCRLLLNIKV